MTSDCKRKYKAINEDIVDKIIYSKCKRICWKNCSGNNN